MCRGRGAGHPGANDDQIKGFGHSSQYSRVR
jgi:hypothetical protein